MASGEAEPLQYTTTVLRVSIHCEGCKKKVKKVLHSIEGVYKVTVDAAQHKVTVTGSLAADALIRRLHKAGKQAALWPPAAAAAPPAVAAEAKKPQEVAVEAAPALPVVAVESSAAVPKAEDPKPKEAAKDKGSEKPPPGPEADAKEKKPAAKEKKAHKAEAAKPTKDVEAVADPKEKGSSPLPAAAAEAGAEEPSSGKKGKKNNKKSKAKDGGEGEDAPAAAVAAGGEKPSTMPAPAPVLTPGAFPYYAAGQPVVSYNVAIPSSSVSYYVPTPAAALPMHPMPPYGYPPPAPYHPGVVPVPAPELLYGPPGVRSSYPSPPQESYNNMFNEENANSCSLM
ncbi:hypothetical protein U9M48_016168 [Paspalum notatum var. saurae]|uniref:HMA domain-containing protein n=1 Tax=Paspalum notatum var. saurae TaxID=547442 RepID=A0AAQ3T4S1_PASNO